MHRTLRELLKSALRGACAKLKLLGSDRSHARQLAENFRRRTEQFLTAQRDQRNNEGGFVQRARKVREQFEQQMLRNLRSQDDRRGQARWEAKP